VTIDAYECDPRLVPVLEAVLRHLATRLRRDGVTLRHNIVSRDFILEHAAELRRQESLFGNGHDRPEYEVIIGNPPYFKLPKSDLRARAAEHVVHGQPNIYALFMAVSASLLAPSGELVFITPRSFTSGPYFRRFREQFFARVQPEAVHVFDSRREAFGRDGVLQENMILKGRCREHWPRIDAKRPVRVSVSRGACDIAACETRAVPLCRLLDMATTEKMLRIPSSPDDERIIRRIDRWTGSLSAYGMQVSTGPVVPFRAVELLSMRGHVPGRHAPLLWLQNVHPMQIEWPTRARRKPQYISTTAPAAFPLLVRDRNYVLLRRFSAKEECRRLTAAPLLAGRLGCDWIGLENHLNYVYRPGDSLTADEALGLAVIYNSQFMDAYFRVLNGNTQVSATEIRKIPLPPLDVITEIGRRAALRPLDRSTIEDLAGLALLERSPRRISTV
jgi:adenine-specific DNA-methyltransferase